MLKGKQKIHKFAYIFKYLCKNVAKNSSIVLGRARWMVRGQGLEGETFHCIPFWISHHIHLVVIQYCFKRLKIKMISHKVLITQLCPTLCDPMDCSQSGFSVHRILQARILLWDDIPFSRGSSWPRDQTQVSPIAGRLFMVRATREGQFYMRVTLKGYYLIIVG